MITTARQVGPHVGYSEATEKLWLYVGICHVCELIYVSPVLDVDGAAISVGKL
jgi:hypothetical protein